VISDFESTPRPTGLAADIGADEIGSGVVPSPPSAPADLVLG
jgi:hypothetical protein